MLLAGPALAGLALAGRALAEPALAGPALAGPTSAGRALSGRALAGRALSGRALAGVALASLVLAGCAQGGSGTPPAGSPAARATVPPPAATATRAGQPSRDASASAVDTPGSAGQATTALIEFGRRGGIAGLVDRLEVRQDGGFTLFRLKPSVNRTGRLTATELADLNRKIDASGFASLPGVENASGNDLFVYHLTYRSWQILAQDGGIAAPLAPVIAALSGIVEKYGS
ncbi:hypothetical protein Raf01_29660 [Rugosimonospora africana]|uniref:Lipoprotein n=2 Tax=Rugosimonospora africana TaxID=556532 RepID=A0A8J3QQP8_9ACTN|nr:hypothetical protein Raf01_29660 [Rugosimonospora africana]